MNSSRLKELKRRLPAFPDILGREHYNCSAILVPLLEIEGEEHLLFEKRAAHIRQGSEVCFPGGHFDPSKDQNFLDTALRETEEELGIDRPRINVLGRLDTLVSPRGIIVECFLGNFEIADIHSLQLEEEEVDEVFTVPISWFKKNPPDIYGSRVELQSSYVNTQGVEKILLPVEELGLPPQYKNKRSEWQHRVLVYRWEPHIIWGLTAAVVENLVQKYFSGKRGGN